jgi:EmrB/QacA subfamily drug resistance transporter
MPQPTEPPATGMTHRQVATVITALLVGVLLAALDNTIVAVAMPRIVGALGDVGDTSWVVTAYLLTATASTPLYGRLSDARGRRSVFLAATTIFLVGSALCGLAHNITELACARAVAGLGGGGLMTLALAVVADLVPGRARAKWQGMFGAVYGVAALIGPPVGGVIVDHASWRWLFYVNLVPGLFVLAVVRRNLHAPEVRSPHRLDLAGALLLSGGVLGFLFWIVRGQQAGFSAAQSWLPGLACLGLLAALAAQQRVAAEPVLPSRLFRAPGFGPAVAIAFLLGATLFAAILFVPLTLQVTQGRSATGSGLVLLAMTTGLLFSSVGAGRVIARSGHYRMFPAAGTALVTVAALALTRLGPHTSVWTTVLVLGLLGLGIGMVSQVLVLIAQQSVARAEIGVATASVSFFRQLGGTVGTAVCATALAAVLRNRSGNPVLAGVDVDRLSVLPDRLRDLSAARHAAFVSAFTDATHEVFWIVAPAAALALLISLRIPRTAPSLRDPEPVAVQSADQ